MRLHRYRVVATGLAALSLSACSYRTFAEQERAIKTEWTEVLSDLQRRSDLIPPLVDTVRRYAPDQESVYQAVADSRAQLVAARTVLETIQAANQQSLALERLTVMVENRPEMSANDSLKRLMDQLADAQNSVAVGRMRYNAQVQRYNTGRRQFPGMLTAGLFFRGYPFFEIPPPTGGVPAPSGATPKAEFELQPQRE